VRRVRGGINLAEQELQPANTKSNQNAKNHIITILNANQIFNKQNKTKHNQDTIYNNNYLILTKKA